MNRNLSGDSRKLISINSRNLQEIQLGLLDRKSSNQHSQFMESIMRKNVLDSMINDESELNSLDHPSLPEQHSQQPTNTVEQKKKYKLNIRSLIIEILIAYALTFLIFFLFRIHTYPYMQLLLIVSLIDSIKPWTASNCLLISAMMINISNNYLGLTLLNYPSIIICYISVLIFNERNRKKICILLIIGLLLLFSFLILPELYKSFLNSGNNNLVIYYYYIFPILVLLVDTILYMFYWFIYSSELLFLQIPLFLMGLYYGTMLGISTSDIQFWYLLVCFTLHTINQRTQFIVKLITKPIQHCSKLQYKYPLLNMHATAYSSIQSFHLIILVYIWGYLQLIITPYSTPFNRYVTEWYQPLIIWSLGLIYEIMCIILLQKSKNKLLYGFISNKWMFIIKRGFILMVGYWFFYIGLGVSNYIIEKNIIQ